MAKWVPNRRPPTANASTYVETVFVAKATPAAPMAV
jgi:hypothetical protein